MAAQLGEARGPVAPTLTVESVDVSDVPPNVRRAVNYYLPSGWGSALHAGRHLHGSLRNVADANPNLDRFSRAIAHENDVVNRGLSAIAPSSPSAQPKS